jgi:hypothetical protein
MAEARLNRVQSVEIGSNSYQLVRVNDARAWGIRYLEKPPWDQGSPPLESEPILTWHLGGFKSRAGIPGASEYGQNTDGRLPFRLRPSPKINTVTLTSSDENPKSIFEALGYIWVVCGRRIYRITPSDNTVVLSKDFGEGNEVGIMGLRWETDIGLVCTDKSTNSIWKVSAIGTPDTWTQQSAGTYYPYRLASGLDRLFAVDKTGDLRNVASGLDPIDGSQYADSVQCGRTDTAPTGIVAYDRTSLVAKPEGLFAVDRIGFGVPVLKQLQYDANNGLGMFVREPWVLFPHARGLYRYAPGQAQRCGIERELMDESPLVKGEFRAFASDARWLYGIMPDPAGTNTYILVAREKLDTEPGFGPYIWDTLLHFTALCQTAWVSGLTSVPRLWFGHGNNLAYIKLDDEYALTGKRWTSKMRLGEWGQKDFPTIRAIGKNLTSAIYWDIYHSVDGGAYSLLDVNGASKRVNSTSLHLFTLPVAAAGREIQLRLDYTSNNDAVAGELEMVEVYATPRDTELVPVISATLILAGSQRLDQQIDHRTADDQLNDLKTLRKQQTATTSTGPWGDTLSVHVRELEVKEVIQQDQKEAEYIVEVLLQQRGV